MCTFQDQLKLMWSVNISLWISLDSVLCQELLVVHTVLWRIYVNNTVTWEDLYHSIQNEDQLKLELPLNPYLCNLVQEPLEQVYFSTCHMERDW